MATPSKGESATRSSCHPARCSRPPPLAARPSYREYGSVYWKNDKRGSQELRRANRTPPIFRGRISPGYELSVDFPGADCEFPGEDVPLALAGVYTLEKWGKFSSHRVHNWDTRDLWFGVNLLLPRAKERQATCAKKVAVKRVARGKCYKLGVINAAVFSRSSGNFSVAVSSGSKVEEPAVVI